MVYSVDWTMHWLQRAQNSVARLINPTVWDGEIISRLINPICTTQETFCFFRIISTLHPDQYFVVPSLTLDVTFDQCTINRIPVDTFRANLKNQPARDVISRPRTGSKHRYTCIEIIVFWMTFVRNLFFMLWTDFICFTLNCFLFCFTRSSIVIWNNKVDKSLIIIDLSWYFLTQQCFT